MDAMILDKNFDTVAVLDAFESFIWTDRYCEAGDCEVYAPASVSLAKSLVEDNYLWRRDSEHLMIINSVEISTEVETGVHITVTGESLEAILKRRVIYPTTIEGNLQNGIKKLLTDNIINPANSRRKISNFRFIASTDSKITSLSLDGGIQYEGENLYESIVELCYMYNIGFKVILTDDKYFDFSLYIGQDRSYAQEDNPWVVFSPKFENLSSSNYYASHSEYKNAAYVLGAELPEPGEREGDITTPTVRNNGTHRYCEVEYVDAVGLDRREIFVDASSVDDTYEVTITDGDEQREVDKTMTDDTYDPYLIDEGEVELSDTATTTAFEGVIDATRQYIYGEDFFIGDVVQVVNEFDMTSNSRITEVVWCHDLNGVSITPTFVNV